MLPFLQQVVILNIVFIVKFPVIVIVVYVATSLVNKDEYIMKLSMIIILRFISVYVLRRRYTH